MSEEIKNVINGNYCNPDLDESICSILFNAMHTLDLSTYICAKTMRTKAITDDFEDIYKLKEETTLGL